MSTGSSAWMMPGTRLKLGGGTTTKNGPTALSVTRRRRNTRLRSSPERGFLILTSRRSRKDLHIQKVADKMGEKRGTGHPVKSYHMDWISVRAAGQGYLRAFKKPYRIIRGFLLTSHSCLHRIMRGEGNK